MNFEMQLRKNILKVGPWEIELFDSLRGVGIELPRLIPFNTSFVDVSPMYRSLGVGLREATGLNWEKVISVPGTGVSVCHNERRIVTTEPMPAFAIKRK